MSRLLDTHILLWFLGDSAPGGSCTPKRRTLCQSDCRVREVTQVMFGNISLSPSGHRLTLNSRPARFDNSTKRGKALDMPWSVRKRSDCIPTTPGARLPQFFRARRTA